VTRLSPVAYESNDDGRAWDVMTDGSLVLIHRRGLEDSSSNRRLLLREHALPKGG